MRITHFAGPRAPVETARRCTLNSTIPSRTGFRLLSHRTGPLLPWTLGRRQLWDEPMDLYVGTSGYSYKEWKGTFYPDDLPPDEMLQFYGRHFATVEINNTFYRMPKASVLEQWASEV